jgi:hypothetical protein
MVGLYSFVRYLTYYVSNLTNSQVVAVNIDAQDIALSRDDVQAQNGIHSAAP